jgi:hypothetical protein
MNAAINLLKLIDTYDNKNQLCNSQVDVTF